MRWCHPTAVCRFEGKCMVCDEAHHTMLHGAKATEPAGDQADLLDLSAEASVATD